MHETSRLAKKIKSRELHATTLDRPISNFDFKEPIPVGKRRASRKRRDLSTAEMVEVIHQVLVLKELQKDVAKEHRLKPVLVCQLVSKAKKNPKLAAEMIA